MGYTVEKISGNQVKITFAIAAEKFDEAMQKAYLKTRNRINVQGFRRGKAPRKLIEQMYGEYSCRIVLAAEYYSAVTVICGKKRRNHCPLLLWIILS